MSRYVYTFLFLVGEFNARAVSSTAQIGVGWAHYSLSTRGAPQSDDRRPYERCFGERRCADGAAVAGVPGNWILAGQPCRQVHFGFEGVLGFAHQCAPEVLEADQSSQQQRRFRDALAARCSELVGSRTRLFRGDDSVGAALLAPYFARKDRRVHCQSRRRGVAAAHHRREVFYVCFVDWVRLLHEQYHDGLGSRQVR